MKRNGKEIDKISKAAGIIDGTIQGKQTAFAGMVKVLVPDVKHALPLTVKPKQRNNIIKLDLKKNATPKTLNI